jgi:O-phosphoseryl-tRNA(Cys) synthetase
VLYKWLCQSSEPQIPTAAFVCRDLERARSRLDEYRRSSSQKGAEWVSRFVSPVRALEGPEPCVVELWEGKVNGEDCRVHMWIEKAVDLL